jgi:hypothetical protein
MIGLQGLVSWCIVLKEKTFYPLDGYGDRHFPIEEGFLLQHDKHFMDEFFYYIYDIIFGGMLFIKISSFLFLKINIAMGPV